MTLVKVNHHTQTTDTRPDFCCCLTSSQASLMEAIGGMGSIPLIVGVEGTRTFVLSAAV